MRITHPGYRFLCLVLSFLPRVKSLRLQTLAAPLIFNQQFPSIRFGDKLVLRESAALLVNSLPNNIQKPWIPLQVIVGLLVLFEHEVAKSQIVVHFFLRVHSILEKRLQILDKIVLLFIACLLPRLLPRLVPRLPCLVPRLEVPPQRVEGATHLLLVV